MVKKFIIFVVSFSLLFILFQVGSGILLTLTYEPSMIDSASFGSLPQETTILSETAAIPTFIFALLAAIIAYFIPGKIFKTKSTVK